MSDHNELCNAEWEDVWAYHVDIENLHPKAVVVLVHNSDGLFIHQLGAHLLKNTSPKDFQLMAF